MDQQIFELNARLRALPTDKLNMVLIMAGCLCKTGKYSTFDALRRALEVIDDRWMRPDGE